MTDGKTPFSAAKKYRQDKGTLCGQNDTTNIDFVYIESE